MKCTSFLFAFILLSFSLNSTLKAQKMNNNKLAKIIEEVGEDVKGQSGAWQFTYQERIIMLITDENNNRMRIISPIAEENQLEKEHFLAALGANFHTALDVKYALSDSIMWSIFVHPLRELSEDQVKDAIKQVYTAAITFGSTYHSSELVFPGNNEEEK